MLTSVHVSNEGIAHFKLLLCVGRNPEIMPTPETRRDFWVAINAIATHGESKLGQCDWETSFRAERRNRMQSSSLAPATSAGFCLQVVETFYVNHAKGTFRDAMDRLRDAGIETHSLDESLSFNGEDEHGATDVVLMGVKSGSPLRMGDVRKAKGRISSRGSRVRPIGMRAICAFLEEVAVRRGDLHSLIFPDVQVDGLILRFGNYYGKLCLQLLPERDAIPHLMTSRFITSWENKR